MKIYTAFLFAVFAVLLSSTLAQKTQTNDIFRKKKGKSKKGRKGGKSENGRKKGKSKKGESSPLVATFDGSIIGTATVRYNMDGSFLLALNLNNVQPTSGKVLITEGTSCDEPHNLIPFTSKDLWDGYENIFYTLDEGISRSAFRFNNGKSSQENLGKTVILTDSANPGVVLGCGILKEESMKKVLVANMGKYPGYTGELNANGSLTVTFFHDDTFRFEYDFSGLDANCAKCGVHIHAGTSCDTVEQVLGHGWNSVLVDDLWTTTGGAFYNTDADGYGSGYFSLYNGFGYEENFHHAVVIHNTDGARVGCGVLL